MSEVLGRCDKKQYEHCGPHPKYPDVGQGLPPFGCVNWQPTAPQPAAGDEPPERIWVWMAEPFQWHTTKTDGSDIEYARVRTADDRPAGEQERDFNAGVAACVEKVKERRNSWINRQQRDSTENRSAWDNWITTANQIIAEIESLTDSSAAAPVPAESGDKEK